MRTFQTSLGPVPLWGNLDRFDAARPLLLVIRGAFAGLEDWTKFVHGAPGANVALAHLPGMHSPHLSECSVPAFARAFDEVADQLGLTDPVVLGLSIGGLVGFAMKRAAAVVAIDPPLSTAGLWPLIPRLRAAVADQPELADWVESLFGVTGSGVEDRDYSGLPAGSAPGFVLLAGDPLEPERRIDRLPSLVSEADRQAYARLPHLKTMVIPDTGHNLPERSVGPVLWALRQVIMAGMGR
jgi:pimeloyl-ACP methyl ester carboxylesterase